MRILKQNNIYTRCNVWLCRPPLEDYRYCSLDVLPTDTIASLVVLAFGLSSSYLSSAGLTSSEGTGTGLSSSKGTGTGLSSPEGTRTDLSSPEGTGMMDRLEI